MAAGMSLKASDQETAEHRSQCRTTRSKGIRLLRDVCPDTGLGGQADITAFLYGTIHGHGYQQEVSHTRTAEMINQRMTATAWGHFWIGIFNCLWMTSFGLE
jgi:hypothetical protein